ncbi:T4-like virus tail tube protein gp19 [compost metagenome]
MTIDIDKFRAAVLKEDLGRTNLFKVEFPQKIGINTGGSGGNNKSSGGLFGSNLFRSVTDAVTKEVLSRVEPVRHLTGFFSPQILRAVGLGDMLDKYLQYPYDLGMYVKNVAVPGRTLTTTDTHQDQVVHSMVTGSEFEPFSITFIMTPSQKERQFFLDWMNIANNSDNNKFGFYDNYIANIVVKYYDRQGNVSSVTEIAQAFPIRVSELNLGYDVNNELATFDVTFKYKRIATKESTDEGDNVFDQARHWYEVGKRLVSTARN